MAKYIARLQVDADGNWDGTIPELDIEVFGVPTMNQLTVTLGVLVRALLPDGDYVLEARVL